MSQQDNPLIRNSLHPKLPDGHIHPATLADITPKAAPAVEGESRQLDDQIKAMGSAPNGERVVSMVQFQNRILVATEYHVYEIVDDKMVEIKFQFEPS